MTLTNFEKVTEFNKAFGAVIHSKPQHDLFETNPWLVRHRLNLITEEVMELEDAIDDKDLRETVDALADILYVVYGAFNAFGIDGDKAFDLVHNSNMTKLCKTEEEAKLSVEAYKKDSRYKSPEYRLADDGKNWIVFDKETTKILKSKNYSAVDLTPVL